MTNDPGQIPFVIRSNNCGDYPQIPQIDGEPVPVLYKSYNYIKDEGSIDCDFAKLLKTALLT